jgi:fructuronate reductase
MPAAAPVRIVHVGIGNFARAHQAWYTAHAPDGNDWGIAGFTGLGAAMAEALAPQDGLYTLITRHPDRDETEVIGSLSAVHAAAEHQAYLDYMSRPETVLVTITVTEAGYVRAPDGHLDLEHEGITADLHALKQDPQTLVRTMPARIVGGLLARRAAGTRAMTVLSCDNLPGNGAVARTVVLDLAAQVDAALTEWIGTHIDFATSMVDRITPATTDQDRTLVEERCGYVDAYPVPTEPFHEWVVSGRFPAGRPKWEEAGARIVEDVTPFEHRKLWLLNGSHSLLAYAGSIRGYETIDQAVADADLRAWVELFWDEAGRHLAFSADEIGDYRAALLDRFANPRVQHRLAQIAADGSQKLVVRTLPTLRAEREAGRVPRGCATTPAAWVLYLKGRGAPINDDGGSEARRAAEASDLGQAVPAVLDTLEPGLGGDQDLVAVVTDQAQAITG